MLKNSSLPVPGFEGRREGAMQPSPDDFGDDVGFPSFRKDVLAPGFWEEEEDRDRGRHRGMKFGGRDSLWWRGARDEEKKEEEEIHHVWEHRREEIPIGLTGRKRRVGISTSILGVKEA